ncbi:MAG: hypothetical protein E6H07_08890 [Bacteroidetes bacterium]|nr:MAG: hypothetical protein E6H07_08890 [Bacteroidota bacterium]
MRKIIQLLTFSFLALIISAPGKLMAQADSLAKKEVKEKTTYAPLISFISVQKSDNSVYLKATVQAKVSGTLTKLPGFKIEFTVGSDSTAKKLGDVITNSKGVAILNCKPDQLTTDKEGKLNFKASLTGKDSIESAEELVSVKRARLEITPVKEDSLLTVKVKLIDLGTGKETAVPETDLGVFVKRMFSSLKLGEGKTDEAGEATIEIPNNLPGDAQGNITLLAKLDENEVYGNLEAAVTQPWGTPVSDELKAMPRALWSTLPPLWMPITFLILMTAVWGHYIVIIFELFRLRKEEPKNAS